MLTGCGIDLAKISRFSSLEERLVQKLFSESEIKQAEEIKNPAQKAAFFASRFAAKEALVNALGTGFREKTPCSISVEEDELGKPYFAFLPGSELSSLNIQLSLTHEGEYAAAMVVIDGKE